MIFNGKAFQKEPVTLNGSHFEGCTFNECELIYTGVGPVGLSNCTFNSCSWTLTGPASDTVQFMKALYQSGGGGKDLILATLKNIAPDIRI